MITASEFARVFRAQNRGRVKGFNYFWVASSAPRSDQGARIGISVARKVSSRAVQRNRIKRIIRESFRHNYTKLPALDFVLVAQPVAREMTNQELITVLQTIWRQFEQQSSQARV